jgi:hypothetical protein
MLDKTPFLALPLTLTKRSIASTYSIEDDHRDAVAYMCPSRADREAEGKFLVTAANAHAPLMSAVTRAQAVLTRWEQEEPGISALHALHAVREILLRDQTLVDAVRKAQKDGAA